MEPGGDRGLAAEGMSGSESGDQGVLDGVGSLLAVAEGTQRHRPEPVAMTAYELTEGVRFACDVPGQEIPVVRIGESRVVQR
jgi:hypothetical protein